jgi:hypothetical protein
VNALDAVPSDLGTRADLIDNVSPPTVIGSLAS